MYYNGKNVSLREYVEEKHKEYIGLPAYRWDEAIVWVVLDYYGAMGEFSEDDWNYINEMGLQEIAAECVEN